LRRGRGGVGRDSRGEIREEVIRGSEREGRRWERRREDRWEEGSVTGERDEK
jgi:hypothetical protein